MTEKNCKLCFHYDVCYAVGSMSERAETCSKYAPDVEEVRHGEWKEETKFIITDDPDDDGYWRTVYICSECERKEWRKEPYCHCGAKMDGGTNEETV